MNLGEIRAKFRTFTGRADLVSSANADTGADFFINAGQRWLDMQASFHKKEARYAVELPAGAYFTILRHCLAMKSVWVESAEGKWQLERVPIDVLRAFYGLLYDTLSETLTPPVQTLATPASRPLYWSPFSTAPAPDLNVPLDDDAIEFRREMDGLTFGEHYEYRGLMFLPAMDVPYTISIWGNFFSPELSADTDKSFWSAVHPDLLVMAAAYKLEVAYRNTEGAKDWLGHLRESLDGIDKELADEDNAYSQMEG